MQNLLDKNLKNFAIFPCIGNSKVPATLHGFKDAKFGQNAIDIIHRGYNIGVSCRESGIVVIDMDYHDENSTAKEDIEKLEIDLETKLPLTLTQATPSGNGRHLIFSSKGIINPRGKIGKYCDVKCNGYIMFAPSVINGKQYEIIDGIDCDGNFILAELPLPWVDFLNKKQISQKQESRKKSTCSNNQVPKLIEADIDKILNSCAFLHHCVVDAAILSEPEWFSMITVLAQIKNSDELIHKLSLPYPGYSFSETKQKIDNARTFGFCHTCNYIAGSYPDICSKCSYNNRRSING